MPKGHKDGCQCRICKAVQAKVLREAGPNVFEPEVPAGPILASVRTGGLFRYQKGVYQKINVVGGNAVVIVPGVDDESFLLSQSLVIELVKAGREIEAE